MRNVELTREMLTSILESACMDDRPMSRWLGGFREELSGHGFLPDGECVSDPRTGDRVVYNAARASRPLDNRVPAGSAQPPCIVCHAKLTRVVDVADLSAGFTFINKNLYPIVFPEAGAAGPPGPAERNWGPAGVASYGLHLLQWTSSRHEDDWHNMSRADRLVVVDRWAALERKLLSESAGHFPASVGGREGYHGYVPMIKNFGAPVGGSVAHGHQQIVLTNVMPRKMRDDWQFLETEGEPFTNYLLRENPRDWNIIDYGPAVLMVPFFMRRPFDMLLVFREPSRIYLHDLDADERIAFADGFRDGIRLMRAALASMNKHTAYNIVIHNGTGGGFYVEFLPYSQEVGGYEQSGFWSCQADRRATADWLRKQTDSATFHEVNPPGC